jgi:hypothetical protein
MNTKIVKGLGLTPGPVDSNLTVTRLLLEGVLHGGCRPITHPGQDVAVVRIGRLRVARVFRLRSARKLPYVVTIVGFPLAHPDVSVGPKGAG